MKLAALALALATSAAHPAVIGVIDPGDGAQILLHDERGGPCPGNSKRAEFRRGSDTVSGCWAAHRLGLVAIIWLDGDFDLIPQQEVRPPKAV